MCSAVGANKEEGGLGMRDETYRQERVSLGCGRLSTKEEGLIKNRQERAVIV